jgi:shikimate dehydrogenase
MQSCTEVDADARVLGSVNTVRFDRDATRGFNTDGPGFVRAIEEDFGMGLAGLKVVIAGAGGGAGQAIAAQCVLSGVAKLVLVNRTVEKLRPLVDRLTRMGSSAEILGLSFTDESLADQSRSCDLIVNTSSVGLKDGDPAILSAACLLPRHCVYDTIYQPAVTPLLALAGELGCRRACGLSMLLQQGVLAFRHWFALSDPMAAMRAGLAQRS